MSNISETLEELIITNGYTQKTFAEKAKINESCITRYIRNKTTPTVDILVVIADFFNCSTDFLLGREEFNDKLSFNACAPFCERIIFLKNFLKLTDKQFYDTAEITKSRYFDWKNGSCKPSLYNIIKIADKFGLRVDFILGRES